MCRDFTSKSAAFVCCPRRESDEQIRLRSPRSCPSHSVGPLQTRKLRPHRDWHAQVRSENAISLPSSGGLFPTSCDLVRVWSCSEGVRQGGKESLTCCLCTKVRRPREGSGACGELRTGCGVDQLSEPGAPPTRPRAGCPVPKSRFLPSRSHATSSLLLGGH